MCGLTGPSIIIIARPGQRKEVRGSSVRRPSSSRSGFRVKPFFRATPRIGAAASRSRAFRRLRLRPPCSCTYAHIVVTRLCTHPSCNKAQNFFLGKRLAVVRVFLLIYRPPLFSFTSILILTAGEPNRARCFTFRSRLGLRNKEFNF